MLCSQGLRADAVYCSPATANTLGTQYLSLSRVKPGLHTLSAASMLLSLHKMTRRLQQASIWAAPHLFESSHCS